MTPCILNIISYCDEHLLAKHQFHSPNITPFVNALYDYFEPLKTKITQHGIIAEKARGDGWSQRKGG